MNKGEGGRAHFMTRRFDREPGREKIHMQSFCAMQHYDFTRPGSTWVSQQSMSVNGKRKDNTRGDGTGIVPLLWLTKKYYRIKQKQPLVVVSQIWSMIMISAKESGCVSLGYKQSQSAIAGAQRGIFFSIPSLLLRFTGTCEISDEYNEKGRII